MVETVMPRAISTGMSFDSSVVFPLPLQPAMPTRRGISRFQALHGLQHRRIQARAALIEMCKDLRAHPGLPELLQVICDRGDGVPVRLALEEFADLVGHHDQL